MHNGRARTLRRDPSAARPAGAGRCRGHDVRRPAHVPAPDAALPSSRYWYRDVRRLDETLDLADEGARSGQEVRFRLVWEIDAGWGRPLTNRAVLDLDGRFLGVPDLIDPGRGVVGEYAGADHRDIDRHASDIEREADFRGVGLEYVEVVSRDIKDPSRIVRRMHEAEERAQLLTARWQLGAPGPSLDEILDAQRRRVT